MADFYASYPVPVNSGGGGSGTVTSVGTGNGLTGGPITGSGTISLVTPVVIANGGTNSTTALNNNRVMKSASGAIVEAAAITAARALISDANGIPTHSVTTATELGYVNGVTSSIQTQLDAKEPTLTPGDISTSTTGVTIGNGTGATVGPDVTVDIATASAGATGILSSTDWSTFNGKQGAGNYITALTGDVTASGPGSVASTVAKIAGTTVSGATGTGNVVFSASPTMTAPTLGAATATSVNKVAITAPATGSTLTVADGKTLTASNTLTFTGTDGSTVACGAGGTVLYNGGALGTPSSGTLTNCTGLPLTGTTGTLPINRGGTGQTTATAAFISLSGFNSKGDLITYTGSTVSILGAGSNGMLLVADSTAIGGVTWSDTISRVKTFNDGIIVDDAVGQSTLNYYQFGTQASTFTSNGTSGGTSGSVTMAIQRVGDFVTVFVPPFAASSGTGTPDRYTANSALPTWARPATTTISLVAGIAQNNGAANTAPALIQISTAGIVTVFRDAAVATFTTSSSCGLRSPTTLSYFIGTGS